MKNYSLNLKVGGIVAVLILGSVTISIVGLSSLGSVNKAMNHLVQGQVAHAFMIRDVKDNFYLQAIDQRNVILEPATEKMATLKTNMETREETLLKQMNAYETVASDIGKKEIAEFRGKYLEWWDVTKTIITQSMNNDKAAAYDLSKKKASPLRKEASDLLAKITDRQQRLMGEEEKEAQEQFQSVRIIMFAISAVAWLIGLSLAFIMLRSLSKAIDNVIRDLSGGSSQVSSASNQIASSSTQLSEASSEQAASLEETVATLEELTSMVQVNSGNAKQAALLAENTFKIATDGEVKMRNLVGSMTDISKDSKRIEEIITVIDDIAFQTNLLALNAAVEAARAGEQGKGFAVVAEAVRNLAQRSASAAKDIAGLIKGSVEKIEQGNSQAKLSGKVLEDILEAVTKVSGLNSEIANASEEQANGIVQISKAMNQLDQVTQVNAATSEEAAAASQELSAQSDQLNKVVDILAVTIKGSKGAKRAA